MKILRSFPPLQAAKIKGLAIALLRKIPENVYEELVVHAR
jgi:cell cycle arrest protein BUB2